jgi:hypothetical protein
MSIRSNSILAKATLLVKKGNVNLIGIRSDVWGNKQRMGIG